MDTIHHIVFEETIAFLSAKDLSRLGRTCKALHSLATRDLYRTIRPSSLRRARLFCDAVKSNLELGRHVRDLRLKCHGESVPNQQQFEQDLQMVLPYMPNLHTFRWLLETKPLNDNVWTLLGDHCPSLVSVELARADGLRPDSDIFRLSGLHEFKISAWFSRLEPATATTVKLPPNHIPPADPAYLDCGRLSRMLLQSPNLSTLHLNMTLRQSPTIDGLLSGRWPRLNELVLIPSPSHIPALQAQLTPFLSAHPTLRTLVLSPPDAMFPSPLMGELSEGDLPSLQVFEGTAKDTIVVLGGTGSGGAGGYVRSEVKTLSRVVVDDVKDLSTLATVFRGRRALTTVTLHVHGSDKVSPQQLGEVCGSLQSVRKLMLDMKCGCTTLAEVTWVLQMMPELRTLLLHQSFVVERDPRMFAKILSKSSPRLKFIEVIGGSKSNSTKNAFEVNRTKRTKSQFP